MSWTAVLVSGLTWGAATAFAGVAMWLARSVLGRGGLLLGELTVLGGLGAIAVTGLTGAPILLNVALAAPLVAGAGLLAHRALRGLDPDPDPTLALGAALVLAIGVREAVIAAVGERPRHDPGAVRWALDGLTAVGAAQALAALGAALAVALVVRRTPIGRRWRAVGEDPTAAALAGVDGRRARLSGAAAVAALAGVGGVCVAAQRPLAAGAGPQLLLGAFGALTLARAFASPRGPRPGRELLAVLGAGAALGVVVAAADRLSPGRGALAGALLVLAVLILRPEAAQRAEPGPGRDGAVGLAGGSTLGDPGRGDGDAAVGSRKRRRGRRRPGARWVVAPLLVVLLVVVPAMLGGAAATRAFELWTLVAAAQAWRLLARHAGEASAAGPAFTAAGGYGAALAAERAGAPLPAALGAGVALALAVAAIVWAASRAAEGAARTLIGWTSAVAAASAAAAFGGAAGAAISPRPELALWLAAGLAAAGAAGGVALLTGRVGLGLAALDADAGAAGELGVDAARLHGLVVAVSAALTGAVGAVVALHEGAATAELASAGWWLAPPVLAALLGGMNSVEGPFLGAAALIALRVALSGRPHVALAVAAAATLLSLATLGRDGLWGLATRGGRFEVLGPPGLRLAGWSGPSWSGSSWSGSSWSGSSWWGSSGLAARGASARRPPRRSASVTGRAKPT